MKRIRTLLTVLALPLVLLACPEDDDGSSEDYDPESHNSSIMGPNALAPAVHFDGPYSARIG